jgi:hypothetical protein
VLRAVAYAMLKQVVQVCRKFLPFSSEPRTLGWTRIGQAFLIKASAP